MNGRTKKTNITVLVIIYILMGLAILMTYIQTNNILLFLLLEIWISVTILGTLFMFLVFPFMIIINKIKNIKLTSKQQIKIVLIITFIVGLIPINYNLYFDRYKIHSKKLYGIDMCARIVKDIVNGETVDIKSDKVEIQEHFVKRYTSGRYSRRTAKICYLKINEGEYEIPISNKYKADLLLFKNDYGKKSINTITIYKNSKLIKEINGIKLSENVEKINELKKNMEHKISIYIEGRSIIDFEVEGCTLREFLNNNNVSLCFFNENNEIVLETKIFTDIINPLWNGFSDGIYRVCICKRDDYKEISNSITYEIKNYNIVSIY